MDKIYILFLIVGIASIAMAFFGKLRPNIMYKKRPSGELQSPERQRFGFFVYLLMGIMFLMEAVAVSIPQWQTYQVEIILTIVMVMTVVMLLMFWKILLSRYERYRSSGLIIVLLLSALMLAFTAYFWYIGIVNS